MVRGADVAPLIFELLAPSEGTSALDFHRIHGYVPDCSISRPCSTARSSNPLAEVHVACRRTALAAPYARGLSHTPGVLHSVITGCRLGPAVHACFLLTPGREFHRPHLNALPHRAPKEVQKSSFGEHNFFFLFFLAMALSKRENGQGAASQSRPKPLSLDASEGAPNERRHEPRDAPP